MKFRMLLIPLLITSAAFSMQHNNQEVPLDELAKNYEKYDLKLQLQPSYRKSGALEFANRKILNLQLAKPYGKLFGYSTLAVTGAGIGFCGLYILAWSAFGALTTHTLPSPKQDPSAEGLKKVGYLLSGIFGTLGLAGTVSGGVACILGLRKIPHYFPKAFAKRTLAEIEHYQKFKQHVENLPKN